ncbi:MAG TPA: Crp/Fnr family transcriptional regulator [Ferruginibacter sp.]|nr:Crp/Fnr family transcriptional regulator [Ferruginibacter sp.]
MKNSVQSFTETAVKIKRFIKGEMIYNAGTAARYFYEVKTGEVKVVNNNDEGNDFIQAIYKPGGIFGVHLLFCDKPHPAAAFANTNCELYYMPKEAFLDLVKNNYDFHLNITYKLSEQVMFKAMMLEEVANEKAEHCLLTLIHYLMNQKNVADGTLAITKQQLANMTGLRVETVIRVLKTIEDKGLIKTTRGNIICKLHHAPGNI